MDHLTLTFAKRMNLSNISWSAGESTDLAMLKNLPKDLRDLLAPTGGFIINHGAIHFRGCTIEPRWNSIRHVYWGNASLKTKYRSLQVDDIPFAHDQLGDFYIWRDAKIYHLDSETGDIVFFEHSIDQFIERIEEDIEGYLNVSIERQLEPGFALHAYPPFCTEESAKGVCLRPVPIEELVEFHADFARQIRDLPEGGKISIELTE